MPLITVNGVPIQFPDSGTSPNWAPAIIEFAQEVATALTSTSGPYDVSPQSQDISASNPGTANTNITALNFSTTNVRGIFIRYTVQRSTNSTSVYEAGDFIGVYNPNNSSGFKWDISQQRAGNAKIAFNITDTGQVQYTCTAISGTSHTGKITFAAQALQQ